MSASSDYTYSAGTGILTITTTSFSAFDIAFKEADNNIPVADVKPISDFPEELDVAYVFSATELVPEPEGENGDYTDEQIEAFLKQVAPYGLWHADFVVITELLRLISRTPCGKCCTRMTAASSNTRRCIPMNGKPPYPMNIT